MSLDDVDLVLAARSGDRAAWAGIYDRYADRLHDFCWSVLRDRDAAADAMQDTFITAYRKLDQLRDPTRLRSWLFAIARNEALGGARRRSRAIPTEELEVTATTAGPDDSAQTAELRDLVWAAAAGLADRDRAALDLHLRQGLEGAALGEALGTTANNANVLMSRLRDQVERSLGAYLVAKKGRSDCAALEALLQPWDGEFTPLWRKRIARHVEDCPTCDESRRRMVSPMALLAGVAVVPAPAHLRDRVLNKIDLISATTPIGADTRDRRRRRRAAAAMVAALLLLLAGLTYQMTNDDSGPASLATAKTLDGGLLPPTSNGPTVPTSPAGGETTLTTRRPTTATTAGPGGVTPTTVRPGTTIPPATTTTTVPLTVSATRGAVTPSCGTPAQIPITAAVRGGAAPYRVTASFTGPGTSGTANLNPSGSSWTGSLTFASPGTYTWWVTARDATGMSRTTPQQSVTVNPCPQ